MSFAIRPFAEDEVDGLYAEALHWRQRPAAAVIWGADPNWDGTPSPELLEIDSGPVVLHALKPSENGSDVVLRLFNTSRHAQTTCLRGFLAMGMTPCDFLEQKSGSALDMVDGVTTVTFPPLALRSFRVGLSSF
jgi:alpha-mannosidase